MGRVSTAANTLWERFGSLFVDLCAVGVSLLVGIAAAASTPLWVDLPRWLVASAGLVGTVALVRRHQRPLIVTLIGVAVVLLSANPVPAVVGLYSTAAKARDRQLVVAALFSVVGFAISDVLARGEVYPGAIVSGVFQAALIVAVGAYVGARRDLLASLRERADRAEAERELRADQARTAERARIAREMHDVLAHKVSLIALHAGALEVNGGASRSAVSETASLIRVTAHQTLEELRDVLGVLHSEAGDGSDLMPPPRAADIVRLVEASRAAGISVSLVDDVTELPDPVARAVYRVVQEALTNVHKHAPGSATAITLRGDEASGIEATVTNRPPTDRRGGTTGLPGAGAGLVGLAERVRLLGGTFASGSTADGGWMVRAWLPWQGQGQADVTRSAQVSGPELTEVPRP